MIKARNIENYENAYIDRKKDFTVLRKANRKVLTMYMGGIYLECLLKTVIIKKQKVLKSILVYEGRRRVIYWYNKVGFDKLTELEDPDNSDYRRLSCGFNPDHNLITALKQIDELSRTFPAEGIRRLEMINRPFNNLGFANLRYVYDDQIPDSLYNEWEENFVYFNNYFIRMKKTLIF